jgi:hypothetical protein
MPTVSGPFRDPEEDKPSRRRKTPKALARMRREFTYERRLASFREAFDRDPASDNELDAYAEEYIRELYNSGLDEI